MDWFRKTRFSSSYVALFALALQLVLSFGHVHLGELGIAASAAEVANTSDPDPLQPGNVPDSDEFCAICAVISLSGALVIPQAPTLVLATTHHDAVFSELAVALGSIAGCAQFQARAPPA